MKESFRQKFYSSGGNPIAYNNLTAYPTNLSGFLIVVLWNLLESANLFMPKSFAFLIFVNIALDVVINLFAFFTVLRTNPLQQPKYMFVLVAWNLLDAGFNFLVALPNFLIWAFFIRIFLDVLVNTLIILVCYRKPESLDFVPIIDQVLGYNEGNATVINTNYAPTEDSSGFVSPPNTTVGTVEDMRKIRIKRKHGDVPPIAIENIPLKPSKQKPVRTFQYDNVYRGKMSDVDYLHYLAADRFYTCFKVWTEMQISAEQRENIFKEVQEIASEVPDYEVAYRELVQLVGVKRKDVGAFVMPNSMETIKMEKERYESML